jgi:hypothetical protein
MWPTGQGLLLTALVSLYEYKANQMSRWLTIPHSLPLTLFGELGGGGGGRALSYDGES